MTATELVGVARKKKASSVEITEAFFRSASKRWKKRCTLTSPSLPNLALDMAREADRRLARGYGGPLTGIPIAVKDNMCIRVIG